MRSHVYIPQHPTLQLPPDLHNMYVLGVPPYHPERQIEQFVACDVRGHLRRQT